MNVTPSFFRVLGVQPFLGRTFTDAEGELGNQLKIVLSYGLWQSAFGGDASIVGRDVRIDGTTYTVVGVMPQDFVYQRPDVMLWRALAFTPIQKSDQMRHSNNFQQIAPAEAGCDLRAGAGRDRPAERGEPRALSAIQGNRHQCRLPHARQRGCRTTWSATSGRRCT